MLLIILTFPVRLQIIHLINNSNGNLYQNSWLRVSSIWCIRYVDIVRKEHLNLKFQVLAKTVCKYCTICIKHAILLIIYLELTRFHRKKYIKFSSFRKRQAYITCKKDNLITVSLKKGNIWLFHLTIIPRIIKKWIE